MGFGPSSEDAMNTVRLLRGAERDLVAIYKQNQELRNDLQTLKERNQSLSDQNHDLLRIQKRDRENIKVNNQIYEEDHAAWVACRERLEAQLVLVIGRRKRLLNARDRKVPLRGP